MEAATLKVSLVLALLFLPVSAWASPRFARWLGASQYIRPEGPASHQGKAGTPTMGGLIPLFLILVGAGALWVQAGPNWPGIFTIAAMFLAGMIGFLDDLRSQRKRRSTGLFPRQTILFQFLAALILVFLAGGSPQTVRLPFVGTTARFPIWAWASLLVLGFLGTVNGVNLADGLDGLAIGLFILALLGLFPLVFEVPGLPGLGVLGLGAGLGFLWANAHPARVFLGNVGSMGLGGFLFGLAWSAGGILFLPLVGGVFVLEALSVILQVGSFKISGVRFFKMSPLHHHLEDVPVSWSYRLRSPAWLEFQVVARLWVLGASFALLGVLAYL